MTFIAQNADDPFLFDHESMKELGKDLHEQYAAGEPFPHVVIDDFLPEEAVRYCVENFPKKAGPDSFSFDRDQERYKTSFHPDFLQPRLRHLFYSFNSRPFITMVENITGIKGLIPDPYFSGAGFHEIKNGGHLSMHADFNHHKRLNLERRVNLLVYLNEDWKEEYGGQLELWTQDMTRQVHSIVPLMNRCAIFTTTQSSMHGNPQPVNHPQKVPRRSIALYYYTSTWSDQKVSKTTQFKVRPQSNDSYDWEVRLTEVVNEVFPPIVARRINGLRHKLSKPRISG